MVRRYKVILPVVIFIVGITVAWLLSVNSPRAQRNPVVSLPPLVQVVKLSPQDVRIPVFSQGTVRARVSTNISAEVTGRIIDTSPLFANG